VCTPLSANVFLTLATRQHLEYHCKALFETPCVYPFYSAALVLHSKCWQIFWAGITYSNVLGQKVTPCWICGPWPPPWESHGSSLTQNTWHIAPATKTVEEYRLNLIHQSKRTNDDSQSISDRWQTASRELGAWGGGRHTERSEIQVGQVQNGMPYCQVLLALRWQINFKFLITSN
jgi:hypothetical protein